MGQHFLDSDKILPMYQKMLENARCSPGRNISNSDTDTFTTSTASTTKSAIRRRRKLRFYVDRKTGWRYFRQPRRNPLPASSFIFAMAKLAVRRGTYTTLLAQVTRIAVIIARLKRVCHLVRTCLPFVASHLPVTTSISCSSFHSSFYHDTTTSTTIGTTRSTPRTTPIASSTFPRTPGRITSLSRTTLA